MLRFAHAWAGYAIAVLVAIGAAALALLSPRYLSLADAAMLYLLAVVLVSTRFGAGPAILAALVGVAGFDWVLPPSFQFSVADMGHAITLGVMIFVSLFVSGLTERLRREERRAKDGERRAAALYELERALSDVHSEAEANELVLARLEEILNARGQLSLDTDQPISAESVSAEVGYDIPGGRRLALRSRTKLDDTSKELAVAFLQRLASTELRLRLAGEAEQARVEAQLEGVRAALLSSVSHDLRTPLATISASAQMLLRTSAQLDGAARLQLLSGIAHEADRLDQLLRNLLAMTRVETGKLQPQLLPASVEELLAGATRALESRLSEQRVLRAFEPNLPLVDVDAPLITQALINVLENAVRYSGAESAIRIAARSRPTGVEISIADEGIGIPESELRAVFEKFRRASNAPRSDGGVGLGLTIVKAIVEAHDGEVSLESSSGKGTRVLMRLPTTRLASGDLELHLPDTV